jgi:hypothetical protein
MFCISATLCVAMSTTALDYTDTSIQFLVYKCAENSHDRNYHVYIR